MDDTETFRTFHKILKDSFGFPKFRPGQEDVLRALWQSGRALAVFPTGGGKSLCYQLPALIWDGITIVVSPLIALMKDQIDSLKNRGISAARLDSSLSAEEMAAANVALDSGTLKLLYVAPERFNNERFIETIRRQKIDPLLSGPLCGHLCVVLSHPPEGESDRDEDFEDLLMDL